MIYKIYNTSASDITISDVVFTALDYTVLINTDDIENPVLTNGIKLADTSSSDVGVYVTNGTFTFYEDNEAQSSDEFYTIANNWTDMLRNQNIPFYDDGSGQYYDLENKILKIYNPVTSAWETDKANSEIDAALALKADKHEIIVTDTPVDTGNIWAIMSIPHSTFTQTFGGVFFFETYSSSSGTQVAGALAIMYCNDTDTVSINSMYGSTPYYMDDGSTVTVYINCGSDDVKLRWTSPTAGDMADSRVSMDWIIATPTIYTGSGMSLSTAGTLS